MAKLASGPGKKSRSTLLPTASAARGPLNHKLLHQQVLQAKAALEWLAKFPKVACNSKRWHRRKMLCKEDRDHLAPLQETLLQAKESLTQGLLGKTTVFSGANGVGKTFIVNLLMLATEQDGHSYRHVNGGKSQLQGLLSLEGIPPLWRSAHVAADVSELASYQAIDTIEQLRESLGPKVQLHQPSQEDVTRFSAKSLNEHRRTVETIREYTDFGEARLSDLTAFFWPSEKKQAITTCCINQSSHGDVWHAVLTYQSLSWVEEQVREAVAWLRSLPEDEREDYLTFDTNPGDGDAFKLEVFKLFVKDPTTVEGWELKDEVVALADRALVFAGLGQDNMVDRCYVREKVSACLEEKRDEAGRVTNELERAMLKGVDGYGPCAVLKGRRLLDGPGYLDANPFRRACADRMIGMADTVVLVIERNTGANQPVLEALFETRFGRSYAAGQHNLVVYHYIEKGSVSLAGDSSSTGQLPSLDMVLRRPQQLETMRTQVYRDTTDHIRSLLTALVREDIRDRGEGSTEPIRGRVGAQVASIMEDKTVLLMPLLVLHTSLMLNWRKVLQLETEGHDVSALFDTCQGFAILDLLDRHLMVASREVVSGVREALQQAEISTRDLLDIEIAVGAKAQHLRNSILQAKHSGKKTEGSVLMGQFFGSFRPILDQFGLAARDIADSFFDSNEVQANFTGASEGVEKRWVRWSKRFETCNAAQIRKALDPQNQKCVTGFNVPLFFFKGFRLDIQPLLSEIEAAAGRCADELAEFRGLLIQLFGEGTTRSSNADVSESLLASIDEFCASSVLPALKQGLEWWKLSGRQQNSRRRLNENIVTKGWLPEVEPEVLRERVLECLDLQKPMGIVKQQMADLLSEVFPAVEDALRGRCQDDLDGAITDMTCRLLEGGALGKKEKQQPLFIRILMDFCSRIQPNDQAQRDARHQTLTEDVELLKIERRRFAALDRALSALASRTESRMSGHPDDVSSESVGGLSHDMPRAQAMREECADSQRLPLTLLPRLPGEVRNEGSEAVAIEGLGAVPPTLEVAFNAAKLSANPGAVHVGPTTGHSLVAAFCRAVFGGPDPGVTKQCERLAIRSLIHLCYKPANIRALEASVGCSFGALVQSMLQNGSPQEALQSSPAYVSVQLALLCHQFSVNVVLHNGGDVCWAIKGNLAQAPWEYHLSFRLERTTTGEMRARFFVGKEVPAPNTVERVPSPLAAKHLPPHCNGSESTPWAGFPFLHLVLDAETLMDAAEFTGPGLLINLFTRGLLEAPNAGRVGISVPFSTLLELDRRKDEERSGPLAVEALEFVKLATDAAALFPIKVQTAANWAADPAGIEHLINAPNPAHIRGFGLLQYATSLLKTGAKVAVVTKRAIELPSGCQQVLQQVAAKPLIVCMCDREDCGELVAVERVEGCFEHAAKRGRFQAY